jgi:tetratricopeptide (TPR) repeat protein
LVVAVVVLSILVAGPSPGQDAPTANTIVLTSPVLRTLARLQEDWLDWLTAFYRGDQERADAALSSLMANSQELGMEALPNLSLGAAASAVRFAREGDFEKAHWGVEAAEMLDPGRPEVAFAAARVASLQGVPFTALQNWGSGVYRSFRMPLEQSLWANNLLVWILCVLLLTGGAFVALEMATRGVFLFGDLLKVFSRYMPRIAGFGFVLLFLLWPLALPSGLLWLLIYWSILLWNYAGTSERFLLLLIWVFLVASPLVVEQQQRKLEIRTTPTLVTMDSFIAGRLDGDLIADMDELRVTLPESVPLIHLLGDLQLRLGQWETAENLYLGVIGQESENRAALNDTGVSFYERGEFDRAIDYFRRASDVDPPHAAAHFNLSQVYSDTYRFSSAGHELEKAQALDNTSVGRWIQGSTLKRVVSLDGGIGRSMEIEDELLVAWGVEGLVDSWLHHWRLPLVLPLIAVFAILSIVFRFVAHPRWRRSVRSAEVDRGVWAIALRLIPGFTEAEMGYWVKAYVGLFIPIALLTLPLVEHLGYRIPWMFGAGGLGAWLVCSIGLAIYFTYRLIFR